VFDDLASERGRQRRPKIGWIHAHVRRDNPLSIKARVEPPYSA
ncbi:hypothetical protein ABIC02_007575, partial [Bradyrhizobium sp. RT5a]